MKKRWQTSISLLVYILLLTYITDFDLKVLLDFRSFFVLLAGTFLLTLPFYHKDIEKEEYLHIYGAKAIEAGLIQVFLLSFVQLSENKSYEKLLADVIPCFRPILYAFCIRYILVNKDRKNYLPGKAAYEIEKISPESQIIAMPSYENCKSAGLTPRESEISLLICQGFSNKEISETLFISETTVKKHVSNIFEKTGIRRREELISHLSRLSSNE